MRRVLAAAVIVAAAAVTTACASKPAVTTPTTTRLVFVGDSLTQGRFADTREEGFPQLVAASLRRDDHQVDLELVGIPGAPTAALQSRELPGGGDVLVIEAGTNDFLYQTPRDQFEADYRSLIATAKAASPGAKLLCLTMWIPPDAEGKPPTSIPASFYNETIRSECDGGTVVDISPLFDATENRGPAGRQTYRGPGDDFHPNSAGHAEIARLVEAALV